MNLKVLRLLFLSTLLCSCTTKFFGSPHVDRSDCQKKCESWNMELSGMVAMGEYSSGCVCKVKQISSSKLNSDDSFSGVSAGVVAAVTFMEEQETRSSSH